MLRNKGLHTITIAFCMMATLLSFSFIGTAQAQVAHIYVDAVNGDNATADGTESNPYKTITFALAKEASVGTPDPWHIHIRPGTYDADPEKPAIDREIFPLALRNGMTLEGTTSAAECIIDGQHATSVNSLIEGIDVSNIAIRNLTLENMSSSYGRAIYLKNTTEAGSVEGCVIQNNKTGFYVDGDFTGNVSQNTFSVNSSRGFRVIGTFEGNVSGNTFSGNSADGYGAGFYVGS